LNGRSVTTQISKTSSSVFAIGWKATQKKKGVQI